MLHAGIKVVKKVVKVLFVFLIFLLFFLAQVINLGTSWAKTNYNYSSFDEILYTLGTSVTTASEGVLEEFFQSNVFPPLKITLCILVVFLIIYILYRIMFKNSTILLNLQLFRKKFSIKINLIVPIICAFSIFSLFTLGNSISYAMDELYINEYLDANTKTSSFFEKEYVHPKDVSLKWPKKKRNLIYIFLESMESTYADTEHGGAFDVNYIPELTDLAEDNTNFSSTEDVGGATMLNGSSWTMGGIVAETAGIPIKTVFGPNSEQSYENGLVNGAWSLGDILKEEGYHQSIMVGSDLDFGGRKTYFTGHGNFDIYDYYTAIDDDVIDDDYYVFWGLEDNKLFDWAKDELEKLSEEEEPFNFMMLTVDTHAPDGYTDDSCENKYDDKYLNSIACSSEQVTEFIEWIQDQDFYDNTTIVLTGDHISMNNYSFDDIPKDYERGVYNVYINSLVDTDNNKNREFSTFDYYPTTLASLGVKIKGNRLGLGTNLFSNKKTLSEKYGSSHVNEELKKKSSYYDSCINFNQCK